MSKTFNIEPQTWITKALQFANRHDTFCYLNPNNYENGFNHLLAIGANHKLESNDINTFESLKNISKKKPFTLIWLLFLRFKKPSRKTEFRKH